MLRGFEKLSVLWYHINITEREVLDMKQFVPYEKLSKKKRRELDAARRTTWGAMNPVSRKIENAKAYNRKKHQRWTEDPGAGVFCF